MKSVSEYLRNGAAVLLLLLAVLPASGQVKDRQHSDRLESARKLYYSGSYYAAEKAFTELGKESSRDLDRTEIEAYKVKRHRPRQGQRRRPGQHFLQQVSQCPAAVDGPGGAGVPLLRYRQIS